MAGRRRASRRPAQDADVRTSPKPQSTGLRAASAVQSQADQILSLQRIIGNRAVSRLIAGTVQRTPEAVNVMGGNTKSFRRRRYDDDAGNSVRVTMASTGKEHKQGESLSVDYDERALDGDLFVKNQKDTSGVQGDHALITGGPRQGRYIRISGLHPGPSSPAPQKKPTAGGISKRTGEVLGTLSTGTGMIEFEKSDRIKQLGTEIKSLPDGPEKEARLDEKAQLSNDRTDIDLVSSSIGGGAQLFSLVNSIQKFLAEKDPWKKTSAGLTALVEVAKTGALTSEIVDKAGKLEYGSGGGYGGQVEGMAQGVEKSTAAAGILGAIAEILAGIVAAIKRVKAIVDMFTKKTVTGAKEKVSFVLATIKDATSIAKSAVSAVSKILGLTGGATDALKSAVPGLGIAVSAVDLIARAYKFVIDAMNRGRARAQKAIQKQALAGRLGLKRITKAAVEKVKSRTRWHSESPETKELVEDYLMARELQTINEKRMTRQGIKIGLDINNIVAEALNLGGVTAAAGITMKVAGGATNLILPAFRRFKQWGRDKAAKAKESGKEAGFFKMFNAKKSTGEKKKQRREMVERMFKHMADWWNMKERSGREKTEKETEGKRVKEYFKATGMSWTAVESYESAKDLANDLDAALKARE